MCDLADIKFESSLKSRLKPLHLGKGWYQHYIAAYYPRNEFDCACISP